MAMIKEIAAEHARLERQREIEREENRREKEAERQRHKEEWKRNGKLSSLQKSLTVLKFRQMQEEEDIVAFLNAFEGHQKNYKVCESLWSCNLFPLPSAEA